MTTALQSQSDARQWEAEGQSWWVVFNMKTPIAAFYSRQLAEDWMEANHRAQFYTICVRRVWCRGMGEK